MPKVIDIRGLKSTDLTPEEALKRSLQEVREAEEDGERIHVWTAILYLDKEDGAYDGYSTYSGGGMCISQANWALDVLKAEALKIGGVLPIEE